MVRFVSPSPLYARSTYCGAETAVISGVLAIRDLDVPYEYACGRESLRVSDLTGIFGSSLRSLIHKAG